MTIAWAGLVIVVQVLLKKHNCSGCYYYGKACHLGWGKLASWMYKQDSGNLQTGVRLSLFYVVSPPLFIIAAALIGIFIEVGIMHWMILCCYLGVNMVAMVLRFSGCRVCAMRMICPGSAVKSE